MNAPAAVTLTVPLLVVVDPLYVRGSLLASVADTEPVTTPVVALGVPTVGVFGNGTALAELRPLRRRRFVAKAELLAAARQLTPIDAAAFRSDVDEVLDQSLERAL